MSPSEGALFRDRGIAAVGAYAPLLRLDRASAARALKFSGLGGRGAGFRAVAGLVHAHDLNATILHLLGLDHERLTYYHNGINRRLTNVHGEVVREILA